VGIEDDPLKSLPTKLASPLTNGVRLSETPAPLLWLPGVPRVAAAAVCCGRRFEAETNWLLRGAVAARGAPP
jgi:hypothetical protein